VARDLVLDIATPNFSPPLFYINFGEIARVIASVAIDIVLHRVVLLYAFELSVLVVVVFDEQAIQCFKVVQYEADAHSLKGSDRACDMKRTNPS
jgi:hypothetical protein